MKLRVGIVFGGQSAEHEVSLQSGQSIIQAIDQDKYELFLIGIAKNGNWYLLPEEGFLEHADDPDNIRLVTHPDWQIALIPHEGGNRIVHLSSAEMGQSLDVVFSIIHGTFGEDGGLQGYFNILNLAFVGADILGASVGMDKDTAKQILIQHNIPVADFVCYHRRDFEEKELDAAIEKLGLPLFIKPSSSGSSIGVKKACDKEELCEAIKFAFQYDDKVLVEEFVQGREIECSVLGNEELRASLPGEIIPQHEFYSYEAKYIDSEGALLVIPAELPENISNKVGERAKQVFEALNCKGLARVDFFLTEDNRIILNEINTLPGFTKISMYPKLWGVTGLSYPDLIDELIRLAIERHEHKKETLKNILLARE